MTGMCSKWAGVLHISQWQLSVVVHIDKAVPLVNEVEEPIHVIAFGQVPVHKLPITSDVLAVRGRSINTLFNATEHGDGEENPQSVDIVNQGIRRMLMDRGSLNAVVLNGEITGLYWPHTAWEERLREVWGDTKMGFSRYGGCLRG